LPKIHFPKVNGPSEHEYPRARMTGVVIHAYVLQIKEARSLEVKATTVE
jgi:hypothetical protein